MKKLQMVDLQTQYEFIKDQVDSTVLDIFKKDVLLLDDIFDEGDTLDYLKKYLSTLQDQMQQF